MNRRSRFEKLPDPKIVHLPSANLGYRRRQLSIMRMIGHLAGEATARIFGDYLYVKGIENQVEAEPGGQWAIWIDAEDEVERAKTLLAGYKENPTEFQHTAREALKLREQANKEKAAFQKKSFDREKLFPTDYGFRPLTFTLIGISVAVFLLSGMGKKLEPIASLFITEHLAASDPWRRLAGLTEIRHGEVWRLFSPILIHFSGLHIFFNMLWLRDLGTMIEARLSAVRLAALVLGIGAVSNLVEYVISGPVFGGMSGVVYGLFGYVWLKGKFDPGSGLFLHRSTVIMMMIWFFLCFSGLVGRIANGAHAAGLVMGMAWGFLDRRS